MKKITLLIAAAILSFGITSAQSSLIDAGFTVENEISVTRDAQADCTTEIVSTSIDMGFGNLSATEVSDNFIVPAGEFFEVTDLTVFVIAATGADGDTFGDITVRFYESAGEFPGALIAEDVLPATSSTNLGPVNGDLDAVQLDLTLNTPVELLGQDGAETTFWFSIFTPNTTSGSNFLETTDETSDTVVVSFKTGSDPDAAWSNMNNGAPLPPGVAVALNGDCDALSVSENVLADAISLFPNPSNGDINLNLTRNLGAASVNIINVSGQKVLSSEVESLGNTVLQTAALSRGVYFAQISTEQGSTTIKFVKN